MEKIRSLIHFNTNQFRFQMAQGKTLSEFQIFAASIVRHSLNFSRCLLHKAPERCAADFAKIDQRGMGSFPHQAAGGNSDEFPPAVFWLQKTLLAANVPFSIIPESSLVQGAHQALYKVRQMNSIAVIVCFDGAFFLLDKAL